MITKVRVEGMTCQHCIRAVFTSLTGVEGITRANVSLGAVEVEHDGRVTVDQLREAIAVAGYTLGEAVTDRRRLPIA
ncbi:MAG TPA: cation transporter [Gemmatimonadaceae bacterium]|nr:cation transporter [Gemmatimonadaceae bacterium]